MHMVTIAIVTAVTSSHS